MTTVERRQPPNQPTLDIRNQREKQTTESNTTGATAAVNNNQAPVQGTQRYSTLPHAVLRGVQTKNGVHYARVI